MLDVHPDVSSEEASRRVARVVWGLLMIWTGAALLLHWGWGIGLIGAGAILLGAQAFRRRRHLRVDGFGLAAGLVLVVGGAWNLLDVAVGLVPILCIAAGVVLLVSAWSAGGSPRAPTGHTGIDAPTHPRP